MDCITEQDGGAEMEAKGKGRFPLITAHTGCMPGEMDAVTRRLMQMEIEEAALKKETDDASKRRLETLQRELADLKEKHLGMTARWEKEKSAIQGLRELKKKLEQARKDLVDAQEDYDLNKSAELSYGIIPDLERQLKAAEEAAAQDQESRLLREAVTDEEIADIVSRWTGIPVSRLVEGERDKLLRLEDTLHVNPVVSDSAAAQRIFEAKRRQYHHYYRPSDVDECGPGRPGRDDDHQGTRIRALRQGLGTKRLRHHLAAYSSRPCAGHYCGCDQ